MQDDDRPGPPKPAGRKGAGAAGGILVAVALAAAKFKTLLLVLLNFKWLLLAPKLLLSFGTLFLSVVFYGLVFGWKFGIVLVALLAVHEAGHYVTFRNFGIPASLPMFIPGLGAFVSSPMSADPARNAIAAIMGPVFGVAAAAICWAYGWFIDQPFWVAAAYFGFILNFFNLIPALPLDGGRVAGAVDGRIWLVGAILLIGWLAFYGHFSAFTVLIVLFVLFSSIPRGIAAFRGRVDPTIQIVAPGQRLVLAVAYFALLGIAGAGAAATNIDPHAITLHS